MSFSDIEASRQKGSMVNLFMLRYGSAPKSYFAYTDAEQPITHMDVVYLPTPIMRGRIAVTGTLDKAVLEVRVARNTPIADLFLYYPPPEVVNITILQGHLSDPSGEFLVGWTGRVTGTKRTDSELVLSCEPVATSMKRVGLRRHYQYSCMHVLYGPQCRANKSAATIKRPVESLTANTVTMESGWVASGQEDNYIGGMVEWINAAGDREYRTILRISSGRVFTLSGPTGGLNPGSVLDVVRGCPRTMAGCLSHDNIHNFGGCPWIPKKNPIGSVNQFY